ncbi:protein of unknown function [Taphrina deformans PYCC 5710]|uniref:EF-hand domain-containing protein n=1 Tax=Taphrina deformans (strain PYCC 5710 / ATCC 11124 / CBS 356.35 / IMI 108563 / JCM 9778 / NBRC 8474) TaxID=1097556 RepID=R4XD64_TAPDE|nr:protein of unknown function [Taphrina deformans PYCC 5710]|eukprot:CCG83765.1 protein of unknown function [Taphrina deformans PYCC 5710]
MSLPHRQAPIPAHLRKETGKRSTSLASTPLIPEQFKESFSLLDKDGDGLINRADLGAMWTSLGVPKSESELSIMLNELPSPLNFAAYFTAMTGLLTDMSSREDLMGALTTFDEGDSGKIDVKDLKEALTTGPNAMTEAEVDSVIEAYSRNGKFNYNGFVESIAGAA